MRHPAMCPDEDNKRRRPTEQVCATLLTSVPKDQIVDALKILDTFFAPEGGSVFYIQKGEILRMKMIPATVSGGGAFFRRIVFGIQDYNSKFPHMGWLVSQWHNALYQVLEPYLKKD